MILQPLVQMLQKFLIKMLQFQGGLDHGYSNAQIVAAIAMIKTYNKEGTILDIYNFLRNFCLDLGDSGKDNLYGYGMPQFSKLTISDIDKDSPEFTAIEFENETWEALKQVKINEDTLTEMDLTFAHTGSRAWKILSPKRVVLALKNGRPAPAGASAHWRWPRWCTYTRSGPGHYPRHQTALPCPWR